MPAQELSRAGQAPSLPALVVQLPLRILGLPRTRGSPQGFGIVARKIGLELLSEYGGGRREGTGETRARGDCTGSPPHPVIAGNPARLPVGQLQGNQCSCVQVATEGRKAGVVQLRATTVAHSHYSAADVRNGSFDVSSGDNMVRTHR